ncbi:MAG TPA: Gfo/Idh/MocA family oxidoreductase [Candidatus Brocadiia bacterium]|nr:Gfo/Idh/MocA family oxidoreductase [Candidatus Brocadiia bacterium]
MPKGKTKIGIIGCGNISGIYFQSGKSFENLEVVACSDLDMEKAGARGAEFGVPACPVQDLLSNPEIEIVVNLTVPKAHAEVNIAALKAGKSAYCEKPFATSREDGRKVMKLARSKGLLVSGAPDTFLGGGIQTCRKLIDDGWIGQPVASTAFMLCHGHETWHPSPEFYYEVGGGPMFDMGPYYLTALVNLLGPVRRVTAATKITFPDRLITSQPKCGKRVKVETPTHIAGVMDFANGVIGTIVTSFDVWSAQVPCIEIYGTEGTMQVPDPNGFGGAIRIHRPGMNSWAEIPLAFGYADNSRGIGVADMAKAMRSGRKQRAGGELAYHVLDIMCAFHDASDAGRHVELESKCERPAPLPLGLTPGSLDD